MKKLICLLVLAMVVNGCATTNTAQKVSLGIQKVNLGDTFEEVTEKIGEPQQVFSKELTADGKERVIWLYEAIPRPTEGGGFGIIRSHPKVHLMAVEAYNIQRQTNPPYLIIFIDGKVSKIERQKQ